MKWTRAGAVVAVLLIGAGCGSSESGSESSESASPELALLTAAQACAQVEQVNEELDGPGSWPIPVYGEFGEKTAALADQSVPEIADALRAMSEQALTVGSMSGGGNDVITAAGEWAERYQSVADLCMRTDSPIGRLP